MLHGRILLVISIRFTDVQIWLSASPSIVNLYLYYLHKFNQNCNCDRYGVMVRQLWCNGNTAKLVCFAFS